MFDLDKVNSAGDGLDPVLLRTTKIVSKASATCVAVDDHQTMIAVGFDDGSVTLLRGDVTRDRGTKRKALLTGNDGSKCSGMSFKTAGKTVWLYVATTTQVMTFDVSVRDKERCTTLDSVGCQPGMVIQVEGLPDVHFITGSRDLVYFYTQDGRGQCYPIEGDKTGLHWFRNYLVVASESGDKNTLTVFDVSNKFIAYTAPIAPIKAITSEWGTLFAISAEDNRLYQLTEKDIQSKLDVLFKKNFYDLAIKIARSNQYDTFGLKDIYRQYGDHLYAKKDYTGAIDNYVKTTGHLEPSYVIRKFLDTHRIHDLTTYLKALHKNGMANKDHTILLINCYTKLKDGKSLDEFIFRNNVDFNVDIAIKVLRQSAYNEQAASLAQRHGLHQCYLEIQLDDQQDYGKALEYISGLEFVHAEASMKKYGGMLLQKRPQETVSFLKVLCTDYRGEKVHSDPDNYLHHFFRRPREAIDFLEHIVRAQDGAPSELVFNSLLENYLLTYSKLDDFNAKEKLSVQILETLENPDAKYDSDHALVMCQLHGFHRGTLFLYEKKELYGEILKHHIEQENLNQAVMTCRKFGDAHPGLWLQTLQCVADDCSAQPEQVAEILSVVEEQRLMAPLLVVRTLASSPCMEFGLVRDFLRKAIEADDRQERVDRAEIERYQSETSSTRATIDRLRGESVTFQATKCCLCSGKLELPVAHFLCQHSFHLQCYQTNWESESQCPKCSSNNKHITDIIRSQMSNRDHHDSFHSQLDKAPGERFAVVADYFSRGLFRTSGDGEGDPTPSPKPETPMIPERVEEVKPIKVERPTVVAPRVEPVPSGNSSNPLDEESTNPFGEPDEGPPTSTNPFGEPEEDYDEALNPFA